MALESQAPKTAAEHRASALKLQEQAAGYGNSFSPARQIVLTEAVLEATLALTAPAAPVVPILSIVAAGSTASTAEEVAEAVAAPKPRSRRSAAPAEEVAA